MLGRQQKENFSKRKVRTDKCNNIKVAQGPQQKENKKGGWGMQGGMACLSFPALTMGSLLLFLEALLKSLVYYKQVFPLPQPLHSHSVHILPQLKSGSLLLIRIQLLGGKISQGRGGSFSHILTNTLGPRAVLGISFLFFTTTLHHEKGGSWTPPPVTAFPDGKTPLPPLLSFLPADPRSLKHQPLTSICVSISSSPSSY